MSISASRDDAGDTGNPSRRHHHLPRHSNHAHGNPLPAVGSSKLGVVRVGLGLLVMGDIARAYVSPASPSFLSSVLHSRGDAEIVPGRRGGRNGVGSGKAGGFVVSGGFVEGRRRIRRRAGSSTCAVMVQQQQEQQQVSLQSAASGEQAAAGAGSPSPVAGIPASSPLSTTASATTSASTGGAPSSASRASSNGAGGVASAAVPAGGAVVGVVGAPRRLGVISRAPTGAAQGGGGRLGVVSSAENGSSAAKKAKVKVSFCL